MKLDAQTVRALETILARGERAEIIPTKDGVRIYTIRRKELNPEPASKR